LTIKVCELFILVGHSSIEFILLYFDLNYPSALIKYSLIQVYFTFNQLFNRLLEEFKFNLICQLKIFFIFKVLHLNLIRQFFSSLYFDIYDKVVHTIYLFMQFLIDIFQHQSFKIRKLNLKCLPFFMKTLTHENLFFLLVIKSIFFLYWQYSFLI